MTKTKRPEQSPAIVTQAQLRKCYVLEHQIARLQLQLGELMEPIFEQVAAGAEIEPGTHTACIVTKRTGGRIVEKLVIH